MMNRETGWPWRLGIEKECSLLQRSRMRTADHFKVTSQPRIRRDNSLNLKSKSIKSRWY